MKKNLVYVWLGVSALVAVTLPAPAQAPLGTAFTYQGLLKSGGSPATGGFDLQFKLFADAAGTMPVGATLCQDNVPVANGLFTVAVDFGAAFDGNGRWLEISVRADSTAGNCGTGAYTPLSPRQLLTATPYASFALGAPPTGPAGGNLTGSYPNPTIATNAVNSSKLLSDTASLSKVSGGRMTVNLQGTVVATNPNTDGIAISGIGDNSGVHAVGSYIGLLAEQTGTASGFGVHASGFIGVVGTSSATPYGSGVAGSSVAETGITYGVNGSTRSDTGAGVQGISTSQAPGCVANGGYFYTNCPTGYGVYAFGANSGPGGGGFFRGDSDTGVGVRGRASSGAGVNFGVVGETYSPSGYGIYGTAPTTGIYGSAGTTGVKGDGDAYGGYFESFSSTGSGVFGYASANTGTNYGVVGQNNSPTGFGVWGLAAAASGTSYGVYGQSNSPIGYGVLGSGGGFGVYGYSTSTTGVGIYGAATATSGVNYGVRGATSSAAGYGVYCAGAFAATGTKAFRIDHPDDPANKYLLHYSTESPEVLNAYSGTIALNGAGEAVVELPHYFAKINKDPRYTLTAVGAPMPMLHVAEEIEEAALTAGANAGPGEAAPACSFRIAGGAPGAKVSWRVEALRNDRWVQQRGAPVEVEKQGLEKGTYQHPELYGQPPEKGLNYRPEHERPTPAVVPDAWRQRPKFERPTPPALSGALSGSAAAIATPR